MIKVVEFIFLLYNYKIDKKSGEYEY